MDVKQIIDSLDINLTLEQLKEYVSGRRVIQNQSELSLVILSLDKFYYDFSDDDVLELYDRYESKKLTRAQMSMHLVLLFTISTKIAEEDEESLSKSKMQLICMFGDPYKYYYLDEPLPLNVIKQAKTFFEEVVAVC